MRAKLSGGVDGEVVIGFAYLAVIESQRKVGRPKANRTVAAPTFDRHNLVTATACVTQIRARYCLKRRDYSDLRGLALRTPYPSFLRRNSTNFCSICNSYALINRQKRQPVTPSKNPSFKKYIHKSRNRNLTGRCGYTNRFTQRRRSRGPPSSRADRLSCRSESCCAMIARASSVEYRLCFAM